MFLRHKGNSRDLVARLRADAKRPEIHPDYFLNDALDAAEEIERLRAELAGRLQCTCLSGVFSRL
jgi:hypothetical protein